MKWKTILLIFFSLIVILIAFVAYMRMGNKPLSPMDKVGYEKEGLNIEIVYSRPYKKGRIIFGTEEDGALQPYGAYWRLGANEATTFEINREIMFAGNSLAPGKYSMYATPGKETWRISINSEANRWGFSEPDHNNDVMSVEVPVTYSDEVTEQFTINIGASGQGAEIILIWDTSIVKIPVM